MGSIFETGGYIGLTKDYADTNKTGIWNLTGVRKGLLTPASYPAPVFQSGNYTESFSAGTASITKPSGTVAGDLLIGFFVGYDITTGTITVPSGWTQVGSVTTYGSGAAGYVFGTLAYKLAGASEPSSYSFTVGGGSVSYKAGSIVRYTGAVSIGDFVISGASGGTTRDVGAVTVTVDTSVHAVFGAGYETNTPTAAPTGMSSRYAGSSLLGFLFDKTESIGTTSADTYPQASSEPYISISFVIVPG